MNKPCASCNFLRNPSHVLLDTPFWSVELAQNQAYLGRAYVTSRAHKARLSELDSEEWLDFEQVAKKLETAYHRALGATPFNWVCLMNDAYREKPYNPHVHWHLIPRHERTVQINNVTFKDEEFGDMFAPFKEQFVTNHTVEQIAAQLKPYL